MNFSEDQIPAPNPSNNLLGASHLMTGFRLSSLAQLIFRVDTFFKGTDNFDQLVKIVKVLGEEDLQRYMTKYGLTMPKEVQKLMRGNTYDRKPWNSFINEKNQHLVSDDALDLLNKML